MFFIKLLFFVFRIFPTVIYLLRNRGKQIDWKNTFKNLWERIFVADIAKDIVVRDPNSIYQSGQMVGNIYGNVNKDNKKIVFEGIENTGKLNRDLPFQYGNITCKIINFKEKVILSLNPRRPLKCDVLNGVICEMVR
jgi:hypothetical protein